PSETSPYDTAKWRLVIRKRRFSCRPCGRPFTEAIWRTLRLPHHGALSTSSLGRGGGVRRPQARATANALLFGLASKHRLRAPRAPQATLLVPMASEGRRLHGRHERQHCKGLASLRLAPECSHLCRWPCRI